MLLRLLLMAVQSASSCVLRWRVFPSTLERRLLRGRHLKGKQYQYLLQNLAEVSQVADLTLAPGYVEKS